MGLRFLSISNLEKSATMSQDDPTLADLGLDDVVDVKKLIKQKVRLPDASLAPIEEPNASLAATEELPPLRPLPKPSPRPRKKRVVQPTSEVRSYPWLFAYMRWLKYAGIVGNIVCFIWLMIALFSLDGAMAMEAVFTSFGFNFLFVIAALVQLAVDAKADLASIARTLHAIQESTNTQE
jgi:hypothetical protein